MADIGQVSIRVVPSAKNFVPDLLTEIRPGMRTVSRDLANELASHIPGSLRRAITEGLKNPTTGPQGSKQGEQFGSAFEHAVKTRLRTALQNLPDAKVGVNATEADARLAQLRRNIDTLSKTIGVHISDKAAVGAIEHLRAELAKLQRSDSTLSIRVNAGAASAELAGLQAQLTKLSNSSAPDTPGNPGGIGLPSPLIAGILTALPLVGPLAGAATGALGGLAGAAGVTKLAIGGLNNEMKANSALGRAVTGQVDGLKTSYAGLEATAARGASSGVLSGLKQVNAFLPTLNPLVRTLSHELGDAFSVGTGALLTGLRTASPLLADAGRYARAFATDLQHAAESPKFAEFIAYSRRELPIVVHTFADLAAAGVHVFEALAPIGTVVLAGLNGVAVVLEHIPVGVLTALAVGGTAVYVAFKGMAIINTVNTALAAYATRAAVAAGASEELAAANASAAAGAGSLAAKYGGLSIALVGAATVLLANNAISKHFQEQAAAAAVAAKSLTNYSRGLETTADLLHDFGAKNTSVAGVFNQTFHESTFQKIKDFQIPGIAVPWSSKTKEAKNYFTSLDSGLDQMVSSGNKLGATSAVSKLAAEQGVSVDMLLSKLPKYREDLDAINTSVGEGSAAAQAAAGNYQAVADALGLTVNNTLAYAAMAGITASAVGKGVVSQNQLNAAVGLVAFDYSKATDAGLTYLNALQTFEQSGKTAADRAAFIGATLRAANGDALGYAGSMVSAATANQGFVTAFGQARTAAAEAHQAFNDAKTGVVDLATGTINYRNAAAAPLIQSLQGMQDAAEKAAAATFQHENSIHNSTYAAQVAAQVYQSQTSGNLIAEASQLGLTKDQAKKLADTYFGMPKDVVTKLTQIGADKVTATLNQLGVQLSYLTGHPWVSTVAADTDGATAKLSAVRTMLHDLNGTTATVEIATILSDGFSLHGQQVLDAALPPPKHKAVGGWIFGPGTGTSDQVPIWASNREFMSTARSAAMNGPALEAGNRGARLVAVPGYADGGYIAVGVHAPSVSTSSSRKAAAANKAAIAAAQALATARANIRFTTSLDLSGLAKAALGSTSGIAAIIRKLITDVHAAAGKGFGSSALIGTLQVENRQLQTLANERTALAGKLKAANNLLAAEQKLFSDERAKVAGAVASNFDITSLNAPAQFGTASPAGFLQNLVVEEEQAQKFAAQLLNLRKAGLNKNLIAQLGEAGVGQAGAAVQSLATFTPAQIKQANDLYAKANAAAQVAGTQVATSLYQAGVDSAQGYVNGLTSQLALVDKAAAKLANTVIKQIKKTLGIASPAKVPHGLAGDTVQGWVNGIDDRLHLVRGSAARLANAAVNPAQFTTKGTAPAVSAVAGAQIHVHPSAGMDEEAIGEAAARRLAARRL